MQVCPVKGAGRSADAHPWIRHQLMTHFPYALSAQADAFVDRLAFSNSYCLTKCLAEQMLAERHGDAFPLALVRPAIIGAVAGSPYPG